MDQNMRMIGGGRTGLRIFCDVVLAGVLLVSWVHAGTVRQSRVKFEGVVFRVVKQDPAQVRLALHGPAGRSLRAFGRGRAESSMTGRQSP